MTTKADKKTTTKTKKTEKKVAKEKHTSEKIRKGRDKTVGLDISPPEKKCEDVRCPWHGKLSVRGRAFKGVVRSAKAHSTAIVEWGYHYYFPKYERYERRKSRVTAHNPPCIRAREGDHVIIAECRPISKTKHFVVVGMTKK